MDGGLPLHPHHSYHITIHTSSLISSQYIIAMSLQGQVALVTGGAKNLGAATARELANSGASLALHYNSPSSKNDAAQLESELKQKHPSVKVAFYQADLTSAGAVEKLFQDVLKDFGKIDIVVNNVGKVLKKPITEISEGEYDEMFAYASSIFLMFGRRWVLTGIVQDQLQGCVLYPERSR